MTPPATAAFFDSHHSHGGPAAGWKIEPPTPHVWQDAGAPFFPDQNGRVYELLLANLPIMLHCMDRQGRITAVNRHWAASLGYAPEEVRDRMFTEFLAPASRTRLLQEIYPSYFQSGVLRGEPLQMLARDGTARKVLLSMNAYRGDKGRIDRSVCLVEMPPAEPATRFAGVFANAVHGVALVNPAGEVSLANAAFWSMLGRSEGRHPFASFILPEDRGTFLAAMNGLAGSGGLATRLELRFATGSGGTLLADTHVALILAENGAVEQVIVQLVDARERTLAAASLMRAQKMEAIGHLTGGLAHDFNNLLTVILGNLEMLEGTLPEGDAAKRLAEAIGAARKGAGLTRQMLAFARKQDLQPSEVRINDLVAELAPLLARSLGEQIELKLDLTSGDPLALIDGGQLESALLNLCLNARDAMPEGGRLAIETHSAHVDPGTAKAHGAAAGAHVTVTVRDTGQGMPPEVLDKAFQPFFTTKGKGTGLGLAMVHAFIRQSGGHVRIESEAGRGTAVTMYLPRRLAAGEMVAVSEPDPEPLPRERAAPEAAARTGRVLLVEDQQAVRAIAAGFLREAGHEVVEAEDGLHALALLQQDAGIDLMFSDVVMPGGLNGFDLAQAALSIRPGLRILHTSGYPRGAIAHGGEPRLAEGPIVGKPYRREELQKAIAAALADGR